MKSLPLSKMESNIKEAKFEDLQSILALQKRAFKSVAAKSNNLNIPPMTQTQEQIEEEFEKSLFLKYERNEEIIGSVRAYQTSEKICHIGRLITEPNYQNQGIGTALMKEIEKRFSGCKHFEIFTGKDFQNVVNLYNRLDYVITNNKDINSVPMVFMEKDNVSRELSL